MFLFRLARPASLNNKLLRILWLPYLAFYKVFVEWFLCIELPHWTQVGKNFYLGHGQVRETRPLSRRLVSCASAMRKTRWMPLPCTRRVTRLWSRWPKTWG